MTMRNADFVSLSTFCPELQIAASYATAENFTGAPVAGYHKVEALLSRKAALALCEAQKRARAEGLALKVFDAYRPTRAVAHFEAWAKLPETRVDLREKYYPSFTKSELFERGYIAHRSSHSRGSAVDLTLVDAQGAELDMGTIFDFFHPLSHTDAAGIGSGQHKNRQLLVRIMQESGFKNYSQEWWHFSLKDEAYPGQYFDFPVE